MTSRTLGRQGSAVITAVNEAITTTMTTFGARYGCPPLRWYLPELDGLDRGDVIGHPGADLDPAEGLRVALQWATLFGLAERAAEPAGFRSWNGCVGSSRIEIWCKT